MKSTDKKEKMQQCDLLEVYNDSDNQRLRDTVDEDLLALDNNDISRSKTVASGAEDIVFSSEQDIEREKLLAEMHSETAEKISLKLGSEKLGSDEDEEVNFEDI